MPVQAQDGVPRHCMTNQSKVMAEKEEEKKLNIAQRRASLPAASLLKVIALNPMRLRLGRCSWWMETKTQETPNVAFLRCFRVV